ncbi:MFS transporter [Luteimicrobium subarcticum]|uniref:YNFM family putative membrane transporter n=1 Tax=Luteimicrobium subarcticum TaxID=620910 RepID=A0A2M8WR70_9MICO|nr:MFS transporter [Luteimicrobium subarcticum]PJI93427.1 YNFM family putative membrane transporter [Luteimicrobium subarcticum]
MLLRSPAVTTARPAPAGGPTSGPGLRRGDPAYRRTLQVLALGGLANFALIYYVQPLLPDLARGFGVPEASSGLALSATTLAMLAGLLLAGPLADRVGSVRAIAGSLLTGGVLALLCTLAPTWGAFLACRAGMGLALAILPAAALAYIKDVVADDAHPAANATYITGTAVGGAAGRLVPVPLAALGGWQVPTVVLGLISVAAGIGVVALLPRDTAAPVRMRLGDVLGGTFAAVRDRRLLLLCVVGCVNMGLFVALYNSVSFRLEAPPFDLGAAEAFVYLAYPVGIAAPTLFRALAQRVGRPRAALLGATVAGASVAILWPSNIVTVFVGLGVLTVAFLGLHSVLSGWVVSRAHETGASTSRASSAYLLFYYAGSTVAGTLSTAAWSRSGWTGVTVLATAAAVLGVGLCALTLRPVGASPAVARAAQ